MRRLASVRRPVAIAAALFAAAFAIAVSGWVGAISWVPLYLAAPWLDVVHALGGGLLFGVVGLVTWQRRPGNVVGPLMVAIGLLTMSSSFEWVPFPPLVTVGQLSWSVPQGLIGVLLLAYPTGRIESRGERAWLVGAGAYLVIALVHVLVTPIAKWECVECHSWLVLSYDETLSNDVWLMKTDLMAVLGIGLIALLGRRWLRASRPTRRMMTALWVAGVAYALVLLAFIVLDTSGFTLNEFSDFPNIGQFLRLQIPLVVWVVMPYLATLALFLIPLSLLWGLFRSRWGQVAVSSLAIELSQPLDRPPLVQSLRRALGDGSLQLALWSRPARTYVTPEGLPVEPPDGDPSRAVTRLDGDDGPLAAMIHDPVLAEQRQLIDGVSAVARLALENERLHAEVRAQLAEVRASRERIVSAADEERRRVERNLHDGAQQRLVSLSVALSIAQAKASDASPDVAATLAAAEAELKRAIAELRELARGIHPAILTEAGLGPALESLAEHAAIPVMVDTQLNGRLPPIVEATAYFVAAEGLTNVTKHADASAAQLRARFAHGRLRLEVVDDGVGGADPARGTGLRGLVDRVSALGGSLRVEDGPAGGTRLEAEIPCE